MTTDFYSFEGTRQLAENTAAVERAWLAFYADWFGAENITDIVKVTDKDLQISGIDRAVTIRSLYGTEQVTVTFDEKFEVYGLGNLAIEYKNAWQSRPAETWDGCSVALNKCNDYTVYLHCDGRFTVYPHCAFRDGIRRSLQSWLATPPDGPAFKQGTTVDERGLLSSYVIVPEYKVNEACILPMVSAHAERLCSAEDVKAIGKAARAIRESKNVRRAA